MISLPTCIEQIIWFVRFLKKVKCIKAQNRYKCLALKTPYTILAVPFLIFCAPFVLPLPNKIQPRQQLGSSIALERCNLSLLKRKWHAAMRSKKKYSKVATCVCSLVVGFDVCLPLFVAEATSIGEAEVSSCARKMSQPLPSPSRHCHDFTATPRLRFQFSPFVCPALHRGCAIIGHLHVTTNGAN